MKKRPFLITIEGPDKVGKATQSQLLATALNCPLVEIPFRDSALHTKIYSMLRSGTALRYREAFQAFHVANRLVWQEHELPKYNSDVLVLDRWNASTWVYGRASGLDESCLAAILDTMIDADLEVVLDGEPMAAAEDSYEADVELCARVRELYRTWAQTHGHRVVAANRPINEVHEEILSIVSKGTQCLR